MYWIWNEEITKKLGIRHKNSISKPCGWNQDNQELFILFEIALLQVIEDVVEK